MIDQVAHRAEVEEWRAGRYEALRRDHGWLTLSGLAWLKPGVNRVGSDPAADGGGRFLYTAPPASDGAVIVDFNRAYNPPCVFGPYATCPLPWPANVLPIRIEAGERDRPHRPT